MRLFMRQPLLSLGAWSFRQNRLEIYETLIDMLKSGDTLNAVVLQTVFTKWAERDRLRMDTRHLIYGAIARRLSLGGSSFSQAIRPFIPSEEYLILASGEFGGDLVQALGLAHRNIQSARAMRSALLSTFAQPMVGAASLLMLSVVSGRVTWPDFLRGVPLRYWPAWSQPCIEAQLWLSDHWAVLLILPLVYGAYRYSLPRWTGRLRHLVDGLSFLPWSVYRGWQAGNFLAAVAALIGAGKTVRQSLVLLQEQSSPYMSWQLRRMIRRYDASGEDAMSALRTGLFSRAAMDRLEDAAANRTFDKTLAHVGQAALNGIARTVKSQAELASACLLGLVAIAFLYLTSVTVFGMQEAVQAFLRSSGAPGL